MPDFHVKQLSLARVCGFWAPSMRIRQRDRALPGNKNACFDVRFQSLVRTVEYDVKRLVQTHIFLSVLWNSEVSKTKVFENALEWTGPKSIYSSLAKYLWNFSNNFCLC